VLWAVLALVFFASFVALGTWQLYRMSWKHELIARVEGRIHALPQPAPGPAAWAGLDPAQDEYRRVKLTGTFLNQDETLVQATTELGSGFWVLTPLKTADGSIVLVNRGFVPPDRRNPAVRGAAQPEGVVTVTGLLRPSEPGGAFLRHNDPAAGRWYSRDVSAIAAAHGLRDVAPYFVDEEAAPGTPRPGEGMLRPNVWPAPGLTVVAFRDNHLGYAITWYVLALMVLAATVYVGRIEYRQRGGLTTDGEGHVA